MMRSSLLFSLFLTLLSQHVAAARFYNLSITQPPPNTVSSAPYWYESIAHQGVAPYNPQGSAYQVFRNVKNFGAYGDGVHDDTAAIQQAIAYGSRCVPGQCQSSTTSPAVVYFPAGTYLISSPIIVYYMTNLIGNPNAMPTLLASANFPSTAIALIDADPYLPPSYGQSYLSTNVFYRQVRNLIIDLTLTPSKNLVRGIHWPTAQATSLQNMVFKMSQNLGTQHVGVFIENGSGGFVTDLVFYGGNQAMAIGSQQFTMRNLTFYNSATAIYQGFTWSWTYIGLSVNNCTTGIDMSNGVGTSAVEVESVTIIDSTFTNTPLAFLTAYSPGSGTTAGSLAIENSVFNNVDAIVKGPSGPTLEGNPGSFYYVSAWVQGNTYTPNGPTQVQGNVSPFPRPYTMVKNGFPNYYTQSKPQYQNLPVSSFASVRAGGAKGDGVTDDTAALQAVINSATAKGQVVYFDAGIYLVTSTINIGPGARIVGESYPVIMGSGALYSKYNRPVPVVRVGSAYGQSGVVQWSDMVVSTQGACPGAVLIQWNLASPASSPSGMWDVHTRIGGFKGSNLQTTQCPTSQGLNIKCIAAFQSMLVGNIASGLYLENNWFWTADHDLDDINNNNTRISVFAGRGLTIESKVGNIWLFGTAVEHHVLYQYQFYGTNNIVAGFIQTETPYFQPAVPAVIPFGPFLGRNDPDYTYFCNNKGLTCYMAWGFRSLNSTNVLIYGTGLYSFFNNYDTSCSYHAPDGSYYNSNCQTQIYGIDEGGSSSMKYSGSSVFNYGLSTVGSVSMVDMNGNSVAAQGANKNTFASDIIRFIS